MGEVTVNISGYRQLSADEQALINAVKQSGNALGELLETMERGPAYDKRWVSIAKTHLQQGMMAMVRAIARPEGF